LLIEVVQNASDVATVVKRVRDALQERLRNNAAGLGKHLASFKMMGAFEVDLVNMGTHLFLAPDNRDMMKALGFKRQMPSQYFVHLHAIVGPLDKARKRTLRKIIAAALGRADLIPDQLQFDGLHGKKSKEENLAHIARYMYKSRLQFSDYVYENQTMHKRKRYHTPYKGKQLVDFLKAMRDSQQFKGMKCEFGLK
jgi:hypothetical protein